uniref:Uncharacterized protein n=1 Tax=Tetradesmus obliquus TaxID=3088 RepID=A0A383VJM6_TETOB|eukprot:jgi/Sobl393_1/14103/SZX65725.1
MASCSSTAYDGGVISLSGTCGFCNLAFSVSIRHCATLGCTNVFRCSKIPASGILQHINPQLSFHCPVCCDRANAAALHTEDADAGNPLLATPDSPKAADVASYSMYKWICAPIAAYKREHGGAQGATIQQPTDDYIPFASVSAPSPHSDISLSAADLAELDQLEADYAANKRHEPDTTDVPPPADTAAAAPAAGDAQPSAKRCCRQEAASNDQAAA